MIKIPQLRKMKQSIAEHVRFHRMSAALEQLEAMSGAVSASWEIRRDISALKESYGYLRRYAMMGTDDPGRKDMMAELERGVLTQAEKIERDLLVPESTELYYAQLRYEALQSDSSLIGILNQFTEIDGRLSLAVLSGKLSHNHNPAREHAQALERLFNTVWTTFPLTADDETMLKEFLCNENTRVEVRKQILAAVMLGALKYYDERRLVILAETYLTGQMSIELNALVLLVITIWMRRDLASGKRFRAIMDAVRERQGWREDLKMIFLNLVRTRDSARIARTMTEDVIPGMMKLRPEIMKKFSEAESSEEFGLSDINPEWEEILAKSGVAEKLKELNDLQSEGGDVMYSTFSLLKSFPFFHRVANWFKPFYPEEPEVARVLDDSASDLAEIIDMAPMLCDSDKYSIVFSLEQMPSSNRRMMLDQFKLQSANMAELRSSMLNPDLTSRNTEANNFIHDLYRFFNLFRRKGEFVNPFEMPINLAAVDLFADDLVDTMALEAVAEFYFKRAYYAEAADVFALLLKDGKGSASMYQKAGFCVQQSGDMEHALEMYRRAELLAPGSKWTLKKIANSLKALGRHKEAISYYKRLSDMSANDLSVALNLGHCYLAIGDYDAALKQYYKVDYLDSTNKALRPLAWCTFVKGDYDRSRELYDRILADKPTGTDYLNAGHVYMAMHDYSGARRMYSKALELQNGNFTAFENSVRVDSSFLKRAGVDDLMLSLVLDAVAYPDT